MLDTHPNLGTIQKVSVKCSILEQPKSSSSIKDNNLIKRNGDKTLVKFKPLITTSNESIDKISKRIHEQKPKGEPLVNPNQGDYLLSRTQSTGGNLNDLIKSRNFKKI